MKNSKFLRFCKTYSLQSGENLQKASFIFCIVRQMLGMIKSRRVARDVLWLLNFDLKLELNGLI